MLCQQRFWWGLPSIPQQGRDAQWIIDGFLVVLPCSHYSREIKHSWWCVKFHVLENILLYFVKVRIYSCRLLGKFPEAGSIWAQTWHTRSQISVGLGGIGPGNTTKSSVWALGQDMSQESAGYEARRAIRGQPWGRKWPPKWGTPSSQLWSGQRGPTACQWEESRIPGQGMCEADGGRTPWSEASSPALLCHVSRLWREKGARWEQASLPGQLSAVQSQGHAALADFQPTITSFCALFFLFPCFYQTPLGLPKMLATLRIWAMAGAMWEGEVFEVCHPNGLLFHEPTGFRIVTPNS